MTDETTTPVAPQAGAAGNAPQPQAGNTIPPEPQAGDGQSEAISLDEAKKLRKEAQALRARLKGYEDQETAAQQAAMSDLDKSNKARADVEAKYQQVQKQLVSAHVKLAAQGKGIIDPEMAALAIAGTLELGDDGLPTNLEKALDELIKNKPYLVPKQDAQPASPAHTNTPQLPAMNPGRSTIQSPSTTHQPGQRYRLGDYLK